MSDTPRTDAASRMAFSGEYMVPIEDAQKMERDLAQSKEANAGLMRACDKYESELADAKETIEMLEIRHGATMLCHQAQMDEVTKQRDHYKAACDRYSEDEMLCKLQEVTKQRDELADALDLSLSILIALMDDNESAYDLIFTTTNKNTGEENKMSIRKALEKSIAALAAVKGGKA